MMPLTEKELLVMEFIKDGKENKQIADALACSTANVKYICSRIYDKLGVESRSAAVTAYLGKYQNIYTRV